MLAQCDVVRKKLQDFISVIKTEPLSETKSKEEEEEEEEEEDEGDNEPPTPQLIKQSVSMVEEETATLRAEVPLLIFPFVGPCFVCSSGKQ